MSDTGDSDISSGNVTPQTIQVPDLPDLPPINPDDPAFQPPALPLLPVQPPAMPDMTINPDDPAFQPPSIMGGLDWSGGDLPVRGQTSPGGDPWSSYLGRKNAEIQAAANANAAGGLASAAPIPPDWNYETLQAKFDPSRSNGRTAVFSPDALNAVNQYKSMVEVPRGASSEKLGFLSPSANGGFDYTTPGDISTSATSTSDNATGSSPPGAAYGMHGHIPGRDDGFVDAPNALDPYGDTQSLHLPFPLPMATIAKVGEGDDGYAVGLHEIVNGRLQFRAPIGTLTPDQRRAIQSNLDTEQEKFYN